MAAITEDVLISCPRCSAWPMAIHTASHPKQTTLPTVLRGGRNIHDEQHREREFQGSVLIRQSECPNFTSAHYPVAESRPPRQSILSISSGGSGSLRNGSRWRPQLMLGVTKFASVEGCLLINFSRMSKIEQRENFGGSMLVPSPVRLGIYR